MIERHPAADVDQRLGVGASTMSCIRSRYSKIRSNSANEDCTSVDTCNIDPIGKNSRDCSVVKATIAPALIGPPEG